ncbi:MAG: tRNA (adenosine(37)-N6)-threonylcarbamoyltransferase complex dimerization subunit type 1 TsaB [Gammaproteobacteria bacterium]|nr:tRNA (adenosine(37)-N6)-threonylcarbamoyltransferase complex dimerization subunit type 1 TsaB [Gammaproteobacteria bacterium]
MKILALDTSTEACSVALSVDGHSCDRFELGVQHSSLILAMVDEVLAEATLALADLDALAFGRGPGSFTGLRIGAGVAQGLAFGAGLPVVPVSSLAAMAQGQRRDRVLTAFDARMSQVYWGAYRRGPDGIATLMGDEQVVAPGDVPVPETGDWFGVGSGWDQYAEELKARLGDRVQDWAQGGYPHARDVARLGESGFNSDEAVSAEHALPVYLRDNVAVKQSP